MFSRYELRYLHFSNKWKVYGIVLKDKTDWRKLPPRSFEWGRLTGKVEVILSRRILERTGVLSLQQKKKYNETKTCNNWDWTTALKCRYIYIKKIISVTSFVPTPAYVAFTDKSNTDQWFSKLKNGTFCLGRSKYGY